MEYFSYEDTKEIKETFTSWIGKKAHVGDGTTDTLKEIVVEESCISPGKYVIHFKFESNKKFTASEFLKFNGLERIRFNLPSSKNKDEQAA